MGAFFTTFSEPNINFDQEAPLTTDTEEHEEKLRKLQEYNELASRQIIKSVDEEGNLIGLHYENEPNVNLLQKNPHLKQTLHFFTQNKEHREERRIALAQMIENRKEQRRK